MARDWIPMRLDLADDPAVVQMAEILGLDEDHVVGLCHRFWSWVSRNSNAAALQDVTQPVIARAIKRAEFVSAMVQVGWIVIVDGHVEIPNYERWLSQGAKRRALASKRQSDFRVRNRNASVTRAALPEDRTGEKRIKPPPPTSPSRPKTAKSGKSANREEEVSLKSWKALTKRLGTLGVGTARITAAECKAAGASPEQAHALVDYWESRRDVWDVGALCVRLKNALPTLDVSAGWPKQKQQRDPKKKTREQRRDLYRYRRIKECKTSGVEWDETEIDREFEQLENGKCRATTKS